MTSDEIMKAIIEADTKAVSVRDESLSMVAGFDEYVRNKIDRRREELFAAAEAELALAEKEEAREADRQIEALDRKLERDMAKAQERFDAAREQVTEKIFKTAVGLDD